MSVMYEEIMESVDDLRDRLLLLIMEDPKAVARTADQIGIGKLTLARFIRTNKPVSFATVCKVKKYVEAQEKVKSDGNK